MIPTYLETDIWSVVKPKRFGEVIIFEVDKDNNYLRQRKLCFWSCLFVCLFVCLSVWLITKDPEYDSDYVGGVCGLWLAVLLYSVLCFPPSMVSEW